MTDRITIHDARRVGFCVSGVKAHCKALGVDFRQFLREGMPIEEAALLKDGHVNRIIAEAEKRIQNGGR